MATRLFSDELLDKLTVLVQEGRTPKDLAEKFGVSVSTIHNYKREIARRVVLPSVRGRHSGYKLTPVSIAPPKVPVLMLGTFEGVSEELITLPTEGDVQLETGYMTIDIAGQSVRVDKRAAGVRIDEDGTVHAIL